MTNLQIETKQLSQLTLLETNPRQISKENFQKLKESISKDKEFLNSRPILCYPEDGKLIIYAGNQRYRACQELKMTEVPVIIDPNATKETIKNRVILDNIEFGQWDFDVLANNWELKELQGFKGLDSLLDLKLNEIDVEDLNTDFTLPDGDKAPFQQMTFTMADEQANQLKARLDEIKKSDEYKYCETFGNENSNGNALYCLITRSYEQS